jgi:uncharacterized membrane protein YhaH (DUF805 family)
MGITHLLFGFRGRIGRQPFVTGVIGVLALAALIAWVPYAGLGMLGAVLGPRGINAAFVLFGVWWIVIGLTAWAVLALMVKRLHDRGKQAWWAILAIVPLTILLVATATPLLEGGNLVRHLGALPLPWYALRWLTTITFGGLFLLLLIEAVALAGRAEPNRFGPPVAP